MMAGKTKEGATRFVNFSSRGSVVAMERTEDDIVRVYLCLNAYASSIKNSLNLL
jgi:hypothetical protein